MPNNSMICSTNVFSTGMHILLPPMAPTAATGGSSVRVCTQIMAQAKFGGRIPKFAEWNEAAGTMKLVGEATVHQEQYNKLMGTG